MTIAPVHADGHIALDATTASSRGRARRVPFARNAGHIAVLAHRGRRPGRWRWSRHRAWRSANRHEPRRRAAGRRVVRRRGPRGGAARPMLDQDRARDLRRCRATAADGRCARKILEQSVQCVARPLAVRPADRQVPGGPAQPRDIGRRGRRGRVPPPMPPPRPAAADGDRRSPRWRSPRCAVGEAAGTGAAIAHQVHGAMGFTYEHSLHHATRRLWAWREEFGNEAVWARAPRPDGRRARRRPALALHHPRLSVTDSG